MSDPLVRARLEKIDALRAEGVDPFPARVPASERIDEVLRRHGNLAAEEHSGARAAVAGRLMARRQMGKASFLDLRDGSGKIQIHAAADRLGDAAYGRICDVDVGDFLHVVGEVFRTKRGELTVAAESFTFLAKAIRPLPEKWHGLKDVELRHRHRSLDLISNDESRATFVRRARMLSIVRRVLDERGFMEVETPILQPIPGGASARPFVTHHNVLDADLYLRIALELYLKRVLIGGIDRVYEISKCFRNEGISTEHNPEFTMLELYQAYADYGDMMSLVEDLVGTLFREIVGSTVVDYQGKQLDFTPPWRRVSMLGAIAEASGIDLSDRDVAAIRRRAKAKGVDLPEGPFPKLVDELFDRFVEPGLVQPTFITDYPVEISPLAKSKAGEEGLTERFELFVVGMEIANAFSELNDPVDQRKRFEDQERLRAGGDDEAQRIDEDFLFAMEHGMPPTGGMGVGLDRLTMLLSNSASIRDVILFPALRRKDEA
ncbi:MAG: lysine--tRNA ligase [Candidatus Bipolaricaulota bacterium]|nr:lysine--tRNA ligase [Candidatus Bipolaricaulota bacterium]